MPESTGDPNQHDVSQFSNELQGQCLCGSITVTIKDNELFSKKRGHICHCANCRKVAGSYASANLAIEEEKVTITDRDGTLKEYRDPQTLTGNTVGRFFCGNCGNPVKSETPQRPGKVILKMGMFPRIPDPEMETFASHRHPWQAPHPGVATRFKVAAGGEKMDE